MSDQTNRSRNFTGVARIEKTKDGLDRTYSRVQKFLSSMFQMFIKVDIMNIETIYTEY